MCVVYIDGERNTIEKYSMILALSNFTKGFHGCMCVMREPPRKVCIISVGRHKTLARLQSLFTFAVYGYHAAGNDGKVRIALAYIVALGNDDMLRLIRIQHQRPRQLVC